MKKYNGFNFVELLLVMLILGVIITLTMPLIKNIKDDEDIYRAYMKKATQDITDAATMALMKNPYLAGFDQLGNIPAGLENAAYYNDADRAKSLRYVFYTALNTQACGECSAPFVAKCLKKTDGTNAACASNFKDYKSTVLAPTTPGLSLGSKARMLFQQTPVNYKVDDELVFGYVYIDMNGDKTPNEMCKDRYRFLVYKDRVALDRTAGCVFELSN